jgi:hypothetical protein
MFALYIDMKGNSKRTAGHDTRQLMVSLKACSDEARRVDPALCARACRGQIRESGEQSFVGELEEMRCTLAGLSSPLSVAWTRVFGKSETFESRGCGAQLTELPELQCTHDTCAFAHTAGQKPLTLLHRFFPEARNLAALCRAGVHTSGARQGGPTLIFLRGEKHRARAHAAGAPSSNPTTQLHAHPDDIFCRTKCLSFSHDATTVQALVAIAA